VGTAGAREPFTRECISGMQQQAAPFITVHPAGEIDAT
jgi:hypothetical protein